MELVMKIFLFFFVLALVISSAEALAQYNPYFSQQENIQMQRERDRWMSNLEDYARQPNSRFSSSSSQFDAYLRNLESQIQAEKEAKQQEEETRQQALWAKWAQESELQRQRQAEADRIAYEKRMAELERNTSQQKSVIFQFREKYKEQLAQNNPQALALLGVVSYPILPVSKKYFEKAFQQNPTEYAVLVAVSDFLNNPFPEYQNEFFRVIKLAELASQEGYLPFRMYSCVLIQKSLQKIKEQQVTEKALAYAEKRLKKCLDGLPTEYRESASYKLLIDSQLHFQPATRDFWKDTQEGLNAEALKNKLSSLPFLGSPDDFFQSTF